MRLRLAALLSLSVLLVGPAFGEQTFPYTGYVTTENVYVRSGPGKDYYPTSKLQIGDQVEIYRHDPGGWYAIRPVEGSFAWVSGRYLEIGQDGLATVTADSVAARVGSEFSDIRDVIQVRLHQGETVEVLDEKEFGSQPGSGTWYKIAPPSGEFRWVFGKFIDPDYLQSGVRKPRAGDSPLARRTRSPADYLTSTSNRPASEEKDGPSADRSPADVQAVQYWAASGDPTERSPEQAPTDTSSSHPAEAYRVAAEAPAGRTNKFVEPARDPSGATTLRRISPEELQVELEGIEMELSAMLAEEPTVWKLDELAVRAETLMTQAETALERGRVRLLVNKIARSEDIKRRYDAVNSMRAVTERHNRQLGDLAQGRETSRPELASAGRFDGVGRLARVVPPKLGAPRYALLDEKGDVRCYVTPAPGVNMDYYVGREIGVHGFRGYITDKRAQHVMAKHVTPLDGSQLR